MTDSVRAMRCFTRRSGLLRTTPLFGVVAVPEPPAIAKSRVGEIGTQARQDHADPTGEAGAPNLSTYFCIAIAALNVAYFGAQLARAL